MSTMKTWESEVLLNPANTQYPNKPRDHQVAAWQAMTKHFLDQEHQTGMIVMPTGAGKTVVAANWLLEHHVRMGGRVLWLSHRRSLLRQALDTFYQWGNSVYPKQKLGLIAISSSDSTWSMVTQKHDVVFSSMQSAVRQDNLDYVDLFIDDSDQGTFVVVDEAHHASAASYARLLRRLKKRHCKVLGLTATPVRGDIKDQQRLANLFDESIVYQINRQKLIDANVLAVPCFETVDTRVEAEKDFTPEDYRHLARWGEIAPGVLGRLAKNAPRNKLIVNQYLMNKDRYGPTIVFAADALHCVTLAEEFQKAGVRADYVTHNRNDAQEVMSHYQAKKKLDVIVNVEMLTEGFDAPHTRTVFIARPTKSETLMTQMVGRALRGKKSNGNDMAYLVTFLDSWKQFDVLDPKYVLGDAQDNDIAPNKYKPISTLPIPIELVREAYRLVSNSCAAHLEGVFQCLPHGWLIWWDTSEDDQNQRTVMVFENQREGYDTLLAHLNASKNIPEDVSEDYARNLIQKYFVDAPDPLPSWLDIQSLLEAKRNNIEIHQYTFDDKRNFDPSALAKQIFEQQMTPKLMQERMQEIWNRLPACSFVYRDNFHAFAEDVSRELTTLITPPPFPLEPETLSLVPTAKPNSWGNQDAGYNLVKIRDIVLAAKAHFPNGTPKLGDLRWMNRVSKGLFGFYRQSDCSISINPILNSPDVPQFVMEFLLYHELLHADMPYAGHNPDFKARERLFLPSSGAIKEAFERGIKPATSNGVWRARANSFLDTFQANWVM
ncbi:MAG: DEAD/DEAH box helicase [Pirellulales bacterium]|nr:DEAD/DEAH box helicase [Pirellulales bacterium]